MNMKKLILGVTMMISLNACATTASAANEMTAEELGQTQGFYKSQGLGYVVMDSNGSDIILKIAISKSGKELPTFLAYDVDCKAISKDRATSNSVTMQGERVKMVSQCYSDGFRAYSPKTKKGMVYFRGILENQRFLTINDKEFKTKNYNKFSKIIREKSSGI